MSATFMTDCSDIIALTVLVRHETILAVAGFSRYCRQIEGMTFLGVLRGK